MAEERSEILEYPLYRPEKCPLSIAPEYFELRAQRPVTRVRLWNRDMAWLVSRYQDQRAVLANPRVSSDNTNPGFPSPYQTTARKIGGRTIINMDNPQHYQHRRMLTKYFTTKQAELLRPRIQRFVDDAIDEMSNMTPPVDLAKALGAPVSARTMCAALGITEADAATFQQLSPIFDMPGARAKRRAATRKLLALCNRLVEENKANPGEGMIGDLVTRYVVTGELGEQDAAAQIAIVLNAGYGTIENMIPLGILTLLENPVQLTRLRENGQDPVFVSRAVDELLRYLNVSQAGRRRVALEDIEVGGQVIRAGEGIIMPTESGNRDESVFPDPEKLDVCRTARQHIAFGYGIHQCLGQSLARVELEVSYSTLLRRIPALELAKPISELTFKREMLVYGADEVPVSWQGTLIPRDT